jgi:hypothetical protein
MVVLSVKTAKYAMIFCFARIALDVKTASDVLGYGKSPITYSTNYIRKTNISKKWLSYTQVRGTALGI